MTDVVGRLVRWYLREPKIDIPRWAIAASLACSIAAPAVIIAGGCAGIDLVGLGAFLAAVAILIRIGGSLPIGRKDAP